MNNQIFILECTLVKKPEVIKVRKAIFEEDVEYYLAQGWGFANKEEENAYYRGELLNGRD